MTAKSLSKRLERLETRSALSSTPLLLVVSFVDADRRVVSQIQLSGGSITELPCSPTPSSTEAEA